MAELNPTTIQKEFDSPERVNSDDFEFYKDVSPFKDRLLQFTTNSRTRRNNKENIPPVDPFNELSIDDNPFMRNDHCNHFAKPHTMEREQGSETFNIIKKSKTISKDDVITTERAENGVLIREFHKETILEKVIMWPSSENLGTLSAMGNLEFQIHQDQPEDIEMRSDSEGSAADITLEEQMDKENQDPRKMGQ